jgi:hypothetical protein
MNKNKFNKIWFMIEKEVCRESLEDLLEYRDLTLEDWEEFEEIITKAKGELND